MSEIDRDIIRLRLPDTRGRDIAAEVAQRRGLSLDEMLAPTKAYRISHARHEAMWEMSQRTTLSLKQIARVLKLKDHTTILHGVRQHSKRLAEAQGRAA